jgi:PTH1 family peptidyl-tRNA hydrolase
MKLITGLGNPGKKYALTRHNIGFRVATAFSKKACLNLDKHFRWGQFGMGRFDKVKIAILMPTEFMNMSGEAVKKTIHLLGVSFSDLLVIHDDADLDFGTLRIKFGGGSGGHKGIDSIIQAIESSEFIRIRFGIGRPKDSALLSDYVLEEFNQEEEKSLPRLIQRATLAIETTLVCGLDVAMNKFNQRQKEVER